MPVGINRIVQRFVRGHVYKLYLPEDPNNYHILRFSKHYKSSNPWPKHEFIPVADNKWNRLLHQVRWDYYKEHMDRSVVEEVRLEDLPRYLGAKVVYPEMERIFKGEKLFRRNKSRLSSNSSK